MFAVRDKAVAWPENRAEDLPHSHRAGYLPVRRRSALVAFLRFLYLRVSAFSWSIVPSAHRYPLMFADALSPLSLDRVQLHVKLLVLTDKLDTTSS